MAHRRRPTTVIPELRPARAPQAEIQVRRDRVIVTVALHELDLEDPKVLITPNALRIRSPSDPRKPEYIILLPDAIDPREYRASVRNGILDLVASRWKP